MRDFVSVTEVPGVQASSEQLERLYHRYEFAARFCAGKDVLEVACGAGMGLGYLARVAAKVVGGDIDESLVALGRRQYSGRANIEIHRVDAHHLPFPDQSSDVVLLFEAIYYLARPEEFMREAGRVLRPGGRLLVCSVNKEWPDFNPSPMSTRYYSAEELSALVAEAFSRVAVYGAFLVKTDRLKERLVSAVKRAAVKFHLMPKTMKGKEFLKRLAFGTLSPIPAEVKERLTEYAPPSSIVPGDGSLIYKVLYVVGIKS